MHQITTSVQIVHAQHCNGAAGGRLFGGQLMAWIDVTAGIAARRFTHGRVTTACVDNLNFIKPAYMGDTIVQEAFVTWTGNTSLEVRVDTFVEKLSGERDQINKAYLVFVSLDEDEKPTKVPRFEPETEAEKAEYEAALERRKIRLARR